MWSGISLVLLLPILMLSGLFISPSVLLIQHIIDNALPPDRTSEGQAWFSGVLTAGGAIGMALGGLWADIGRPMAPFFAAAATLAVGSIAAAWSDDRFG